MAIINVVGNVSNKSMVSSYDSKDSNLLDEFLSKRSYNPKTDSILLSIQDVNGVEVANIQNYQSYSQTVFSDLNEDGSFSEISVDPVEDLKQFGFKEGNYILKYSVLRPILNNNSSQFYIKEVFSKRDEIIIVKVIEDPLLLGDATNFKTRLDSNQDIKDFIVQIDGSTFHLANNLKPRQNTTTNQIEIGIKLYKPLGFEVESKSVISLFEELSLANSFSVNLNTVVTSSPGLELKGTNFNVPINSGYHVTGQNTSQYNLTSLINATSLQEINNLISNNNIKLNIDYTITERDSFAKFMNFGSANRRLQVFKQKLSDLEGYIAKKTSNGVNNISTASVDMQISSSVNNFDHYEQYLYFQSGSSSWPKTNSTRPYTLASTSLIGSNNATNTWYQNMLSTGSLFDSWNNNYLWYTMPEFIRNNEDNANLEKFVDMIGHHYDNIWIIIKNMTEIHNTKHDNKLSNEIMYELLKSHGIDVRNSDTGKSITDYLLKTDTQDSQSTYINEIYKRLHHNLALLAKTKGTYEGLRLLLLTLGIPDTIVAPLEHGRSYRDENDMYTYKANTFNYRTVMTGSSYFQYDWYSTTKPNRTAELKFMMSNNIETGVTKSLFSIQSQIYYTYPVEVLIHGNNATSSNANIIMKLSGSNGIVSASIGNLPIFAYTGSWWSLMMQQSQSANIDTYKLIVKNQINGQIAFSGSATYVINNSLSASYRANFTDIYTTTKYGESINGSICDIRIWNYAKKESDFNAFVLNPRSIQESVYGPTASLNVRFPLGTDLNIGTSSFTDTFYRTSNATNGTFGYINYKNSTNNQVNPIFSGSVETFYYSAPYTGIGTTVSNKIYINNSTVSDPVLVYSNKLAKNLVLEPSLASLSIANSTAKAINRDIAATYGNFDIAEYLGDPNNSGSYSGFDQLKIEYFSKYTK
jgi:hypothetical protein